MRLGGSRKNSGEDRSKDEMGEAPGTFDPQCEIGWSQSIFLLLLGLGDSHMTSAPRILTSFD